MPKGPFTSAGKQTSNWTVSGGRDARKGLGYGVLEPQYQLPRQSGDIYPYVEPPEEVDAEVDDESLEAVGKKSPNYVGSDFGAGAGVNPFYFAAGNTKLSDCFWKSDNVLQEMKVYEISMVPIPNLYKGMGPSLGGSGATQPVRGMGSNAKQTGTVQGWSHAPPLTKMQADEKEEIDFEDEIFTLKDLANKKSIENGEDIS